MISVSSVMSVNHGRGPISPSLIPGDRLKVFAQRIPPVSVWKYVLTTGSRPPEKNFENHC